MSECIQDAPATWPTAWRHAPMLMDWKTCIQPTKNVHAVYTYMLFIQIEFPSSGSNCSSQVLMMVCVYVAINCCLKLANLQRLVQKHCQLFGQFFVIG